MGTINVRLLCKAFACATVIVMLSVSTPGCTSTIDPMKASGADLLFNPSRFEEANEERRAALLALRDQHDQLEEDRATLEASMAEIEHQLDRWRAAITQRQQRITELEREIADLERMATRSDREIAEAKQRRDELDMLIEQRATLAEEIDELEHARDILKERIEQHVEQERSRFERRH